MTGEELAVARKKLGWTQEELSTILKLAPGTAAAMESGTTRIPSAVSRLLRTCLWSYETDNIMMASGLPKCQTQTAMYNESKGKVGEELSGIARELVEHMRACPVCKAREDYQDRYAPTAPNNIPIWMRAATVFILAPNRIAALLRVPAGEKGEARRIAVLSATYLSTVSIVYALALAAVRATTNGVVSSWWHQPLQMIVLVPLVLFVGYFVAGTVFDLSRPIAARLSGYVLRGSLCLAGVAAGGVLALTILNNNSMTWLDSSIELAVFTVFGGFIAGILWTVDWLSGRVPKPIR